MKTLVSAETVRQAHARGEKCLPGGKDVLVTPEARGLAEQLGLSFSTVAAPVADGNGGENEAIRAAVLARLPAELAGRPEVVEQIVGKVCAAQRATPPATSKSMPARVPETPPAPAAAGSGGIKRVRAEDVLAGTPGEPDPERTDPQAVERVLETTGAERRRTLFAQHPDLTRPGPDMPAWRLPAGYVRPAESRFANDLDVVISG